MPLGWVLKRFLCGFDERGFFWVVLLVLSAETFATQMDLSPERLKTEVSSRILQVPELRELQSCLAQQNLKAYLMGGLAATFTHYVWMDMQRESGSKAYPQERFHYFWDQIFRPTQDLDMVIERLDSSPELTTDFEAALRCARQIFTSIKVDIYGMRGGDLLRPSIRGSQDWKWQNSDALSVGLVEISTGGKMGTLLDPDSSGEFLKSFIEGKNYFFRSPRHGETARFQEGLNPELISALRFLMNALRFNVEISEADLKTVKEILDAADQKQSDYVKSWISTNAKKLVTHAFDLERSMSLVRSLDLPNKVLKWGVDSKEPESLHWFLTRTPLPSDPESVSRLSASFKKTGKRAKDLGIDIITHETFSYDVFRQIASHFEGKPNFFLSVNESGQMAAFGEALYTKKGLWGDKAGGWHIRLRLDPEAIEGLDFKVHDQWVLVSNRAKIKIVEDDLALTFGDFLQALENLAKDERLQFLVDIGKRRFGSNRFTPDQWKILSEKIKSRMGEGDWMTVMNTLESFSTEEVIWFRSYLFNELQRRISLNGETLKKQKLRALKGSFDIPGMGFKQMVFEYLSAPLLIVAASLLPNTISLMAQAILDPDPVFSVLIPLSHHLRFLGISMLGVAYLSKTRKTFQTKFKNEIQKRRLEWKALESLESKTILEGEREDLKDLAHQCLSSLKMLKAR